MPTAMHGRTSGLALSVALMGVGALMIAFTPDASQIGIAAPILLLLARLLQGLSVGGEYGASLFGGTAEFIALWLKREGSESLFFCYVSFMCGLSLIAHWRMCAPPTMTRCRKHRAAEKPIRASREKVGTGFSHQAMRQQKLRADRVIHILRCPL